MSADRPLLRLPIRQETEVSQREASAISEMRVCISEYVLKTMVESGGKETVSAKAVFDIIELNELESQKPSALDYWVETARGYDSKSLDGQVAEPTRETLLRAEGEATFDAAELAAQIGCVKRDIYHFSLAYPETYGKVADAVKAAMNKYESAPGRSQAAAVGEFRTLLKEMRATTKPVSHKRVFGDI